jgi:AcrR family transcriptional regulator
VGVDPRQGINGQAAGTGEVDLRVRHSKQVVMATTYELLAEEGLAGVTVDAVARRSGVAKTTIYRHWPSREALLLDACAQMGPHFDIPDAGSFPKDLRALAQRVSEQLLSDPYASILLSLMDAAERTPDLAALLAAAQAKLVEAVRTVLARARVRGELRRLPDPSDVAALILGPMLYRRLFSHEPLSEGFFRLLVDNVVRTAGAASSQRVGRTHAGLRQAKDPDGAARRR